ncbi:FAD-dependent oxidoreductase [Nocardioides alcanivorans]|uniref:FAD-dependent oxidoreductase n=1 Tax=Nocardioides alcanivorans TaxID=2897352 RepID=UPI001F3B60B9|nr:FAD-binding protein [Nocardioides alcanivorans]
MTQTGEAPATVESDASGHDCEYDVIVVGTGAAGSAAAIAAHDAGASVLLVEKCSEEEAGGNTRVSGGGWANLGDQETATRFLRAVCGDFPVAADVVDAWAREVVANSDWMRSLGADVAQCLQFHTKPEYEDHEGSECYLGMDAVGGALGNFGLHDFLRSALAERDIPVLWSSPASRLVTDGAGAVVGVRVAGPDGDRRYGARGGVVLATGGFQANAQMVRDYLRLTTTTLWGSPHSTGDGHKLAQAIGADLWHMDNMMTHRGLDVGGHGMFLSVYAADNYIFVNRDARRFRSETIAARHGHVIDGHGTELNPLHPALMVFDEQMRVAGPLGAGRDMLPVGWGLLMEGVTWSVDNSAEIESGVIRRADTIAELATLVGLDPEALEATVAGYNSACAAGRDDAFGRSPAKLAPIDEAPFYAIEVEPMLGWSNGGPRRDGRARVMNVWGSAIPGLYAAGELSSTYSWGKDGGFHIADALAFGRIAGREAADHARR